MLTNERDEREQDPTRPAAQQQALELRLVEQEAELPRWARRELLAQLLHEKMVPYNDRLEDVQRGLDYALTQAPGSGGFVVVAGAGERLLGALVMLKTGMGGYVPENLLLFVVVDPTLRGQGVGRKLIERALEACQGEVKLHVEPDNPARRLYERLGFEAKYVEMRRKS